MSDQEINLSWKRMFGGAGYYANGNMFAAWFRGERFALKLPEDEREELLQIGGVQAMAKQYIEVPPSFLTDCLLLAEWTKKSIDYAETLR